MVPEEGLESLMVPRWLVSVDPGTANAGIAVFENGCLVDAADLKYPEPTCFLDVAPRGKAVWVREKMRKRAKFRVAHKDLAAIEGLMRTLARYGNFQWASELYPETWKAGVPKPQHHARLKEALFADELPIWEAAGPDGRDAIGIGLFYLGRVARGGLPGTWDPLDNE